jgi:hypothetical protein
MAKAGWTHVAVVVGVLSVAFDLRAQDMSPVQPSDEQIRDAALQAAEAKRKAIEESGNLPGLIPIFGDPTQSTAPASTSVQRRTPQPIPGFPSNRNATELEQIEAAIAYRAATGEDKRPHCYFGPVSRRIPIQRVRQIAMELGETEAAWREILATDEDPNLPALSIVVGAPNGPNCHEDLDKALRDRRDELRSQQGPTQ